MKMQGVSLITLNVKILNRNGFIFKDLKICKYAVDNEKQFSHYTAA